MPRSDRNALLMERAKSCVSALDGHFVQALQARGKELFEGRGGCVTCHRIGDEGTRFTGPNLGIDPACAKDEAALTARDPVACRPLAERVGVRRPGLSALEYAVESIVDPDRVVTPTYAAKVMKRLEEPPVSLSDDEIIALATYVVGGACPKSAEGISAALSFMGTCREARDARTP